MTIDASGSVRSSVAAASPSAAAVLRAVGSVMIRAVGATSAVAARWASAVTIMTSLATEAPRRTAASSSVVPSGASGSNCFERAARLAGHNRVPLPPPRMTACLTARSLHRTLSLGGELLRELGGLQAVVADEHVAEALGPV